MGTGTIPDITFTAAQLGPRRLTETVPAGWSLTVIGCTGDTGVIGRYGQPARLTATRLRDPLDIDAGETVICIFTNTKDASLTIIKTSVPAATPGFDFDGSGTNVPPTSTSTTVGGTRASDPADLTFTAAQLGAKEVTETAPAGWTLTGLGCTGDGDVARRPLGPAHRRTLDIDAGETVICTFTNTKDASLTSSRDRSGL